MAAKFKATDVQDSCWLAMEKLHAGTIDAARANAIATNAREVLRAARLRVSIAGTPGLSTDLKGFGE